MTWLKQEYQEFFDMNFKGLVLKQPLFYNWSLGLRFDLQVGETNTEPYFTEVLKRASTLFEAAFLPTDSVLVLLIDYKYKRRKIRFGNYVFKQLTGLTKSEISYSVLRNLYQDSSNPVNFNSAIIKTTTAKINHVAILKAIGNTDFPPRQPRLDHYGVLSSKEVYFINVDQKLIFHMYDDRGLDLIAESIETLRPIYNTYSAWILDYDRPSIQAKFTPDKYDLKGR